MLAIRNEAKAQARRVWRRIDVNDLDGTYHHALLALTITALQKEAARLSAGYLAAFLGSELDRTIRESPALALQAGTARSGKPLSKALRNPMIGVKVAIEDGKDPRLALLEGGRRLERVVGLATDTAARDALDRAQRNSRFVAGWRRAVRGTCGACMGLADESLRPAGTPLEIHPECQCVSEAVAKNDFNPKKGQRAELRGGKELINGEWVDIADVVKGRVAKLDAEKVMINAGTDRKPRWIAGHRRDLFKPTVAPRTVVDKLAHSEQSFMDALSKDEFKAVDSYKGYGYKQINGQLRAGKPGGATVRNLETALEKGSLGSDTTLYRALHLPEGHGVGDILQDAAFMSTSKERQVSARFFKIGGSNKRVLLRIKAKAGTKGGHLPGQNEEEFLLPRNTRLRLVKETVETIASPGFPSVPNVRVIECEIV